MLLYNGKTRCAIGLLDHLVHLCYATLCIRNLPRLNRKFQVRDCLKQNEELRSHLEKLRLEQVSLLKVSNIATQSDGQTENSISNPPQMVIENISLKVNLWNFFLDYYL
jgi:hypothetical protein